MEEKDADTALESTFLYKFQYVSIVILIHVDIYNVLVIKSMIYFGGRCLSYPITQS